MSGPLARTAPLDLAGEQFGQLTALARIGRSGNGANWLCRCSCGSLTIAGASALQQAQRKSCGCALNALRQNRVTYLDLFRGAGGRCAPMSTYDIAKAVSLPEWVVSDALADERDSRFECAEIAS